MTPSLNWIRRERRGIPGAQNAIMSPAVAAPPARVHGEDQDPSGVWIEKAIQTVVTPRSISTTACSGSARYSG